MRNKKIYPEIKLLCFYDKTTYQSSGLIATTNSRLIPSHESIEMIINELKNYKDRCDFISCNNNYVEGSWWSAAPERVDSSKITDPFKKSIINLETEIFKNYRAQCEAINLGEDIEINFEDYWESLCVLKWFCYMLGNSRSFKTQTARKKLSQVLSNREDGITLDISRLNWGKDYSILEKYPEYKQALLTVIGVDHLIDKASIDNPQINELKIEQLSLHLQLSHKLEGIKNPDRPFICPFCQSFKLLRSGHRELAHCGSKKCERDYYKKQKQIHNPKKGWVEDKKLVKPLICLGGCGSNRRKLNTDRVCKQCFPKSFS